MSNDVFQPEAEEVGTPKVAAFSWLLIVAGLTVVNLVAQIAGAEFSMIFGLTSALIASFVFDFTIAIAVTVVLAGVVAGLAVLVRQRMLWALVVAMVLYLLDGLVAVYGALVVGDTSMYLDIAAHGWVLVVMWGSLQQLRAEAAVSNAAVVPGMPVQQAPLSEEPAVQE